MKYYKVIDQNLYIRDGGTERSYAVWDIGERGCGWIENANMPDVQVITEQEYISQLEHVAAALKDDLDTFTKVYPANVL